MRKLRVEDINFPTNNSLRLKDKLLDLSPPKVMGILNCTPDSFYAKSRSNSESSILRHAENFIREGVDILDIGAFSSRPGGANVSLQEEIKRITPVIQALKKEFQSIPLSLDTFRAEVARVGLENGIDILNDISAWEIEPELLSVVAHYKCPYILMHMKGTPASMQSKTEYKNLYCELLSFFSHKIEILRENGVHDIVIDPGFGFAKTMEQNHEILHSLEHYKILGKPLLVGISRKSMVYNHLKTSPEKSLNGTTVLNTVAILKGASILRVHDVQEAKEIIQLLH